MDKMKGKKVSVPVAFAAVWILILLTLNALKVPHHFRIGIYLNLFFILGVIGISMFLQIKQEKKLHTFAVNFKNSLKKAGTYIVIVTGFLFLYLKFINPMFLENLKNSRIEHELAKDWNQVQASSPIFEAMTREEFIEKATSSNEILSSVSLNLSFYFLGLFFISLFYSILIPIFYKKIILRM